MAIPEINSILGGLRLERLPDYAGQRCRESAAAFLRNTRLPRHPKIICYLSGNRVWSASINNAATVIID